MWSVIFYNQKTKSVGGRMKFSLNVVQHSWRLKLSSSCYVVQTLTSLLLCAKYAVTLFNVFLKESINYAWSSYEHIIWLLARYITMYITNLPRLLFSDHACPSEHCNPDNNFS